MLERARPRIDVPLVDIHAAHTELLSRGVDVTEIQVYAKDGVRAVRDGDNLDNVGFFYFSDPDGNGWAVQQISSRL